MAFGGDEQTKAIVQDVTALIGVVIAVYVAANVLQAVNLDNNSPLYNLVNIAINFTTILVLVRFANKIMNSFALA